MLAARALPYLGADFRQAIARALTGFMAQKDALLSRNPFGVPIATGTWGGSAQAILAANAAEAVAD